SYVLNKFQEHGTVKNIKRVGRPCSQLTIVQNLKSEAAATVRSKMVSCFTRYVLKTLKINTIHY
ncbi:MAG: hypothetical protein JAY75_16315, partial [Candidatus Thiodiazotropha taylori]|nr:hypothetical protein [Candidatus Thiodiazotropha taylori]MCW4309780.1 hypothetical protein [Candidatus Thiodiazotropha endolucinida]